MSLDMCQCFTVEQGVLSKILLWLSPFPGLWFPSQPGLEDPILSWDKIRLEDTAQELTYCPPADQSRFIPFISATWNKSSEMCGVGIEPAAVFCSTAVTPLEITAH